MSQKSLSQGQRCPLCQSDQLSFAFQVQYWRETLLDYADCKGCGATFAHPMPSDELISQGNNALVRLYQRDRSLDQEFREARQAYLRGKLLGRKLSRWKKTGRVLELGCYHGFYSLGIQDHTDWQVEGLEISTELSSFVSGTLGIRCHAGTLETTPLPEGHYDFIICHDLIEHINQPQAFLRTLSRILAPGGRVQIITPNATQDLAFTRRAFAAGSPPTMLLNHILYFRPRTLRQALESSGLHLRKLYCYDVRYALKDFGFFGMGQPSATSLAPSMIEALDYEERKTLSLWTQQKLEELRAHPKTSLAYGFFKETLPHTLTLPMPADWEVGHEIYALAEKPLSA